MREKSDTERISRTYILNLDFKGRISATLERVCGAKRTLMRGSEIERGDLNLSEFFVSSAPCNEHSCTSYLL